jgi:steroid delta-isomerase-like uncharacterized protein
VSIEENKALIRRFYDEVVNAGRLELVDELAAPDLIDHEELPGFAGGREGVKQFFATMRTAFPDLRMDVQDIIAEGDKVVARATIRGTHQGEFMGIVPTGKAISVSGIDIVRFSGGKVAEHWGVTDGAAMMQQLGAVPPQ